MVSWRSQQSERATVLALFLVASTPAVALTPEEVAARIASEYRVEVLKVEDASDDGRRLYVLTVMLPLDAGNAAFQVGRLFVDAETGKLVPRLRHRPDGYEAPPAWPSAPEPSGPALRRESLERPHSR